MVIRTRQTLTGGEARARFRAGLVTPTSGWADGYTQANLLIVPSDWAYDALLFAQRNPKPCPVLDVTDPGSPTTSLASGGDLRTDAPAYRVFEDGGLVAEVCDVSSSWRDDLVTFLIGCSFTFERALLAAGVPLRHQEQKRNVPMYATSRRCRPAGRIAGPLVVSMRPIPAPLVATAVQVTARYPRVHGAPVHIGSPEELGIADLGIPTYGDAVDFAPGDVPVFWACGVTPEAAVRASRPPFAITHRPGHMFVTDQSENAQEL